MTDTTEEIRKLTQERIDQEAEINKGQSDQSEITSKFVSECLYENQLGDGTLYAKLFRDKFMYVKNAQEWFEWTGNFWQLDVMQRSLSSVEAVAEEYLNEYRRVSEEIAHMVANGLDDGKERLQKKQKTLLERVGKLRGDNRRTACLKFAHTLPVNPLAIVGDEFDRNPMLFPCANGVVDLETGKLTKGRPSDYLSLASPVEFLGIDFPAPIWEKSILEIFDSNDDLSAFFNRLFGYASTGLVTEKIFPVLYGKTGWNGRTILVETISEVMGEMAGSIPSEMLLASKNVRSSSGPSPDIMSIKGLRMAFTSEIDEHRRFSSAEIKRLTGGDELYGRHPHDKRVTRFPPTHTLFVMTNSQPQAPANDRAFWERMLLIPFRISFVKRDPKETYERRANLNLKQELLKEKPGILAWLIRGCLKWQKYGLNPPREITDATAQYRRDEDLLEDFIEECCLREPGARGKSSDLYNRFVTWYKDNHGQKQPTGTWFGKEMGKKFDRTKMNGCNVYHGIRLDEPIQ